jgi:hypothetical protein
LSGLAAEAQRYALGFVMREFKSTWSKILPDWHAATHMTFYIRVFTLLILISPFVRAQASDSGALLPIIQNGKMGFISTRGEIVIQPQFDTSKYLGVPELTEFSEGMAAVKSAGAIGYIDTAGRFVIAAQFKEARKFSEGLAAVKIDDRWGYIDQRGSIIVAPRFKYARDFSEGLAQVEFGGKLGYIDKTGKFVIEPRFRRPEYPPLFGDDAGDFKDGIANVRQDMQYLMIDRTGKTVGKCVFDCLTNFSDGMALIQGYKKDRPVLGFMDKNGKIAIEPTYGDAGRFSEGLVQVKYANLTEKGGWFYIDRTGRQAINGTFWFAGSFSDGLAAVAKDNYIRSGYIDRTGTMIIKAQFDRAGRFQGGIARVLIGNKWGYIDKTGNYIWEPSK